MLPHISFIKYRTAAVQCCKPCVKSVAILAQTYFDPTLRVTRLRLPLHQAVVGVLYILLLWCVAAAIQASTQRISKLLYTLPRTISLYVAIVLAASYCMHEYR